MFCTHFSRVPCHLKSASFWVFRIISVWRPWLQRCFTPSFSKLHVTLNNSLILHLKCKLSTTERLTRNKFPQFLNKRFALFFPAESVFVTCSESLNLFQPLCSVFQTDSSDCLGPLFRLGCLHHKSLT